MAKTTISFGIILILLGIFGFVATGSHFPTALIPAYVGLVLAILGFLANTENAKKRMLFMHSQTPPFCGVVCLSNFRFSYRAVYKLRPVNYG